MPNTAYITKKGYEALKEAKSEWHKTQLPGKEGQGEGEKGLAYGPEGWSDVAIDGVQDMVVLESKIAHSESRAAMLGRALDAVSVMTTSLRALNKVGIEVLEAVRRSMRNEKIQPISLGQSVQGKLSHVLSLLNARAPGGAYVFSGASPHVKPFQDGDAKYYGSPLGMQYMDGAHVRTVGIRGDHPALQKLLKTLIPLSKLESGKPVPYQKFHRQLDEVMSDIILLADEAAELLGTLERMVQAHQSDAVEARSKHKEKFGQDIVKKAQAQADAEEKVDVASKTVRRMRERINRDRGEL